MRFLPSPLVGEGGASRSEATDEGSLSADRTPHPPCGHPLPQGERGRRLAAAAFASDLLRGFQPRAKRPAPQTGMEKPGTTNGAKPDGSMGTTGISATKGNIKRGKDGAPAPKTRRSKPFANAASASSYMSMRTWMH